MSSGMSLMLGNPPMLKKVRQRKTDRDRQLTDSGKQNNITEARVAKWRFLSQNLIKTGEI